MNRDFHERAMREIPLLYEIALSIGKSLDLETNCEAFLRALLPARNLAYGGVWLRRRCFAPAEGGPEEDDGSYVLAYGMPPFRIRELVLPQEHPVIARLRREKFFSVGCHESDFPQYVTESRIGCGVYAVYALEDIGFLKLYASTRSGAFSYPELNRLWGVVRKFAVSLRGCLAHRQLQVAAAQRQEALDSLRRSEARYRTVVESVGDGMVVLREGRILFANRAMGRMLGLAPGQMTGVRFVDFVRAEHGAAFREYCRRRLMGIPGTDSLDLQMVAAGGDRRRLDVRVVADRMEYEGGPALLVVVQDVTEQRRAETERARLALALEQAGDAVMITDPEGRILYVNRAFEEFWERDKSALLGQSVEVMGGEAAEVLSEILKSVLAGKPWRGRLRHTRRDGRKTVCDTTGNPLCDEKGDMLAYVFVQRDVTRELELQERYYQAQRMESVGRLAGGIAHDFNNIMTAILGFGGMLLEQMSPDSNLRHSVEQIVTAAQRASNLTKKLLTFSRRGPLRLEPVNLNAVLRETEALLARTVGEDIELSLRVSPEEVWVMADFALIQQAVVNLVVNSRDAMPRGGKVVVATAVVDLDEEFCRGCPRLRPGRHVHLTVSDTGRGMTPEVRARAFDPFFTTKGPGHGTGLGLSTTYGIVEQCGGHIEIESEPDCGTVVHIWLPCVRVTAPAGRPPPAQEKTRGGSETILVVEDEALVRDLTVRLLKSAGYTVFEAANGQEAARIVDRLGGRVDLVLTDVIMPAMGGPELAEYLAGRYPAIRILYMTGFTEVQVRQNGKPVPPERLLLKPFSRRRLLQRVREELDAAVTVDNSPGPFDGTHAVGDYPSAG